MKHYSNTTNPVDFPQLSAIDRLWGEALDRAASETYTQMSYSQVLKVKQVFAELIVEEMYDFIMDEGAGDNGIPDLGKVKQHFGVRE